MTLRNSANKELYFFYKGECEENKYNWKAKTQIISMKSEKIQFRH